MEITKAVEKLGESVASSKKMIQVRDCSGLGIGQVARQGDVYIQRVKSLKKIRKIENRQLAPGITAGSRHVVCDDPAVRVYQTDPTISDRQSSIQVGPGVESPVEWSVTHPKHGWHTKLPAGCYQIWYQIDRKTMERVRD